LEENEKKNNYWVFFGLIGIMMLIKIFDIIFNPNKIFPGRIVVFSVIELLITLALGTAGQFFYNRIEVPELLNEKIKTRKIILL